MPRKLLLILLALGVSAPLLAQPHYDDRRPPAEQGQPRYDDRRPPGEEGVSYGYADVLRSEPVYDYVRTAQPRQECYDQHVQHHADTTGGTVLGAIIGGALGNTVGKGDGRTAATIGGAVVGGAIGHNVASNHGDGYNGTETRCRVVDGGYEERRVVAYDVEYRFRGNVYQSRIGYDPGERLRVRVEVTPAD
jgi:uncharacterized protein YcfJ